MTGKHYAFKISLAYLVFGVFWILLSDTFVWSFSSHKEVIAWLSIIKGWLYVGLSAIIIFTLSNRCIRKLSQANQRLQHSYDELAAANEELAATEEDLRQHFNEILQSNKRINTQNLILSTLQETAIGIANQLDMAALLDEIIRRATEIAETPHGFISLVDKNREFITLKVGTGIFEDPAGSLKIEPTQGLTGQVIQTGQTQAIEDYGTWKPRLNYAGLDKVQSLIQVPLPIKQEIVGTIGLAYTESPRHFDSDFVELLERFATMASIALNNAQLHTQVQQELQERQKKEQTIRAIFNATSDAILLYDAESAEQLTCNCQAEELLGYTREEIRQMGIAKFDALHCRDRWRETIINAPAQGSQLVDWRITNRWGNPLDLEINYRKVTIGGQKCVLAVARDVSERKKMQADLVYEQTQKLALLKALPDLILLINKQGVFLDYNQPANFETLVALEEFLGKTIADIFPAYIAADALKYIQQTIDSGAIHLFEYQLTQNNELHYFEARFVKSGNNEVLIIIRDITYKKQIEQKLEYLSLRDSLTGTYNRTYFETEVFKARERKKQTAGVLIGDVDGLKLINDTLGHHAGDELLKVVAKILQSCLNSPDFVARIGGDEFAALVFEPDQQKMTTLSAAIKAAVDDYNRLNPQLPLSLSIGWAANFDKNNDIDSLVKEADNNMYREKMHQGMSKHNAIVQAMMQALEARDYITEGHAERLQTIIEKLAQKLQLPAPMIADLRLLAQFHDIGKVGIPDQILFKPDRLTPNEFAIMQRHCEIGFRIAKSAPDLTPIAEWILKHQEWWNGQGYPLGLAGEAIPLACRILALVDAFDAMTNDRPYRKALTLQEAITEIRNCAGTQFDPHLAEIFIEMLTENPL